MTVSTWNSLSTACNLICETALHIEFMIEGQQKPNPALSHFIASVREELVKGDNNYLLDCVPSYTSLLVYFDFTRITNTDICKRINTIIAQQKQKPSQEAEGRTIILPVYYSPEVAPDLQRVSESSGLEQEEIVDRHSKQVYCVYALGFAPGFAYLGFVDPEIASPRLQRPRQRVPKGSVAIADNQTAIYPSDSPGGWNIIGRTSVELLVPLASPEYACKLQFGDRVKFTPVDRKEFIESGGLL